MRVIAGSAGGHSLNVPPSLTRPTTDRVREALFSSLGERVIDARVLDLYAGSGAVGIEAASRGATEVIFVDQGADACESIRRNLEKTRLSAGAIPRSVRHTPVTDYLKADTPRDRFDLIFADPPYARDEATLAELRALLTTPLLPPALAAEGLFVLEVRHGTELPLGDRPLWTSSKDRRYGRSHLHFLVPVES